MLHLGFCLNLLFLLSEVSGYLVDLKDLLLAKFPRAVLSPVN